MNPMTMVQIRDMEGSWGMGGTLHRHYRTVQRVVEAAKETGASPSRHALHGSPCGPCAKEAAGWPYCRSRAYAALPPLPFDRIPTEEPDGAALWSSAPLPFREG